MTSSSSILYKTDSNTVRVTTYNYRNWSYSCKHKWEKRGLREREREVIQQGYAMTFYFSYRNAIPFANTQTVKIQAFVPKTLTRVTFANLHQWHTLRFHCTYINWGHICQHTERLAVTAQSVSQHTTGWAVQVSNTGGERFSATIQTAPGAHPASYTMDIASFSGVKWTGFGIYHPQPSNTKVKERMELNLYSPSYAFMASYTVNFTLQIGYALKFYFSNKCVIKVSSTYKGQAWKSTEVMFTTSWTHKKYTNISFSVFILLTQTQIMLETVTSVAVAILTTQMHYGFYYIKHTKLSTHISRYKIWLFYNFQSQILPLTEIYFRLYMNKQLIWLHPLFWISYLILYTSTVRITHLELLSYQDLRHHQNHCLILGSSPLYHWHQYSSPFWSPTIRITTYSTTVTLLKNLFFVQVLLHCIILP